ncbi:MAG: LexA family transcriptional regulator [Rhodoferax sp.]|nr:LexA family transcriptional regulator [Rhodoferax sp.]
MALKDRIQELVDAGYTKSKLAKAAGKTPPAVTHWLNGDTKEIKADSAAGLQALTGYSSVWISEGRGPRMAVPSGQSNVASAPMGLTQIPLISSVQAGAWTEVIDNFQPGDAEVWLTTDLRMSNHAFALEIKGDSMLPDFKPGDRVIIDPEVPPQPGDFVVAKNGGNEATFKKYRPRGAGPDGGMIFELVPLNEDFPSIRSDAQPLRIIGTMVEHRKYRKPR